MKKLISVVASCYNEEENIDELYERIIIQLQKNPKYDYEIILADNKSTDGTVNKLRKLAKKDIKVKVIINSRNFGHIRSPYYALTQASGDCAILMASDLQDPPELIEDFIKKWELGNKIVLGVKQSSKEFIGMWLLRKFYYTLIRKIADDEIVLVKNYTGFGLYDKIILDIIRSSKDPYPYFRGFICSIGFNKEVVYFNQPLRKRGVSKNNFYSLYDMAILGIIKHSKLPLRLAVFIGFFSSLFFFFLSVFYFIVKLIYWDSFVAGISPLLIGVFLIGSFQLFFIGLLGEYIGVILTQVSNKPLVIVEETINF
jgi:glycosyltransferase involved in cell wall biosynthesis